MRHATIPMAVSLVAFVTSGLAGEDDDTSLWGELRSVDAVALVTIEDVRLQGQLPEAPEDNSQATSDTESCVPALMFGRVQRIIYQRYPQQGMPAGLIWDDAWCAHFGPWPRSAIFTFTRTDAGWDQSPLAFDLGDELTTSRLAFHVERARSHLATSPVNPRKLAEWALQIAFEADDRLRNVGIQLLATAQISVPTAADTGPKPAVRLSELVTPREIDKLIEPVTYEGTGIEEWVVLLEAFTRERAPALYAEIANGITEELKSQEYCDRSAVPLTMTLFLRMELGDRTENFRLHRTIFGSDCDQLRHIWAEASRQQWVPGDPVPIEWWRPELFSEAQTQPMGDSEDTVTADNTTELPPFDEPEGEPEADDSRE